MSCIFLGTIIFLLWLFIRHRENVDSDTSFWVINYCSTRTFVKKNLEEQELGGNFQFYMENWFWNLPCNSVWCNNWKKKKRPNSPIRAITGTWHQVLLTYLEWFLSVFDWIIDPNVSLLLGSTLLPCDFIVPSPKVSLCL